MKIIESSSQILSIEEVNKSVIRSALILFLTGLLITINSGHTKNSSMLSIFLAGPFLMAISIAVGIYFYSKVSTIFRLNKNIAIRNRIRFNKKLSEKIILDGVDCVEIKKDEGVIFEMTSRKKYNINLKYIDGDELKINLNLLTSNEAKDTGYKIASILNVPLKRIN